MRHAPALLAAALLTATAARAAPRPLLDVPAGTLGAAVQVLARQAGVSIAIGDERLWSQRVPAVRGRIGVGTALARLTRGSEARVAAIDAATWRIDRAPPKAAPPPRAAPSLASLPPPAVDDAPIIVTASKRDIAFADYPGTASRIDGGVLGIDGPAGTDALLGRLASLTSTHLGDGRNKLFIRGIADSSFTGPTQATVGQYLGDVRLTYNAPDPDLRLYDIASVEVLEGPQATLYGAGSLGGVVRIVRNPPRLDEPDAALAGGVSLTQHGDPGGDLGAMVNLPLGGGRAALRVVGYGVSEGGYIDDPLRGRHDINRTRIAGGRAALRVDAGDGWTIDAGATLQDIDGDDSQYADRDAPPLTHSSRVAQGFTADYALGDLVVGKDWDGLRLLSSTGIARQRLFERFDATVPGDEPRLFTQGNHTALLSNETRLWRPLSDGFGWVLGASLLHNRARLVRALGPVAAPQPVTGVVNRIDEATLYGEASVMPLPGLTLTGGGRLSWSRLSGDGEDVAPPVSAFVEALRARIVADRSHVRALPSLAVSTTALDDVILFARYNQGFRPGGLSVDSDFVRRFRSDDVATLESGVRYGAAGRGRADLAAAVAYTRWHDIQADFVDATGLPATANIGDGRIYSLSLTGGWRPLAGLSLDAGVVLNDSRVSDPNVALRGVAVRRIPNVARVSARAGVDYRAEVGDGLDLHVSGSARYTGRSRLGIGPVLGDAQGDYLDTSLSARLGRPALGVTLTLTNLADDVGNRFALGTPYQSLRPGQITPLRPRTVRLGVDAHF